MEDGQIVALYWSRSQQAVAETAEKYGSYCRSIALQILGNAEDAEESVSDVYLEAWNSIPPHRPDNLRGFLGKITRRRAIDKWRRQRAEKRGGGRVALALEELEECIPTAGSPEETLEARELGRLLDEFLRKLPDPERRLFICRYWYLDSISQLARRFGFSQSRVKSMLLRTRKKLLKFLREEGAFDENR